MPEATPDWIYMLAARFDLSTYIARSEQSSPTLGKPSEVVTLSEKMKRVLNIWPQNELCIDALLFGENFHIHYSGGRKNVQIKGLISNLYLLIQYTVQLVIADSCTQFQNSRSSSY